MNLNGVEYYYVRNGQGDIIALIDANGNEAVSYTYDSWGNVVSIDGSLATTVGVKNPYRYRGYRYDEETKLYYLQSRYYNPEWGRFVNADAIVGEKGELLSHNMFAYCSNDAVNMEDPNGYFGIKSSINKLNHAALYVYTFVVSRMYVIQQRINSKILGYIGKVFNKGTSKVEIGTSFGKLGTLIENPSIRVNWDAFAEHGFERMAQRGVTKEMVDSWVANGKALQQGANKYLFITKEGAAVVTKEGKLVTTYSSKFFDDNMIKIVKELFGE
jgi:RHS repeat-associated protein